MSIRGMRRIVVGALSLLILSSWGLRAQETGVPAGGSGAVADGRLAPATVDGAARVAGPVVFLADNTGRLGRLDLGTRAVTVIGRMAAVMNDIAFCPGGALFGISAQSLYRINTATAAIIRIGSYGRPALNSLVCNSAGSLFAGAFTQTKLYRLNRLNGAKTALSGIAAQSAGDLVFHETKLFLSTRQKELANLNKVTGAVITRKPHGIVDLFGLVSTGVDKLYGFAFTKAYRFVENADGPTGQSVLLFDFANKGLTKIFGASFNGNFQS